ncbi:MAG: SIR2 family protein, partial [Planctomycetaceae bacterium]|nr:SIR2 family protein [Planctomycetaceae bacterium]
MFEQELVEAVQSHTGPDGPASSAAQSASDLLSMAGARRRRREENSVDPHRLLAALPFPIYLTTNPDCLLVEALREVDKQPEVGLCPWSEKIDWSDSVFVRDPDFRPSVDRPLVYYLFGRLDDPRSLVLTEDDYFDYLIGLTRNNELIPAVVRRALVDTALLFLGFRIDDWDFRVLFRSLMAQGGRQRSADYAHVAVQIDPEDGRNLDPEGTRRYLQRYFQDADIRIYWGHVDDFARELSERWSRNQAAPGGRR